MRAAFGRDRSAKESFLRLLDRKFQEIDEDDCGPVDVVGYSGMK